MTKIERMLPLYEAKMIHHYDHRWASYSGDGAAHDVTPVEKADSEFTPLPRYWVREELVNDRLDPIGAQPLSLLGWRDICRSTDERTMIASELPRAGVGHTLPLAFPAHDHSLLQAAWSSFAFDFVARQKVGGTHMTYSYLMQLATPHPSTKVPWASKDAQAWLGVRTRRLQKPGSIIGERRIRLRCEVDAAMFHVFVIERGDVDYIMETFPIVKRKDVAAHGEYRTKRLILETYDAMAEAIETGVPYESPFDDLLTEDG